MMYGGLATWLARVMNHRVITLVGPTVSSIALLKDVNDESSNPRSLRQ